MIDVSLCAFAILFSRDDSSVSSTETLLPLFECVGTIGTINLVPFTFAKMIINLITTHIKDAFVNYSSLMKAFIVVIKVV